MGKLPRLQLLCIHIPIDHRKNSLFERGALRQIDGHFPFPVHLLVCNGTHEIFEPGLSIFFFQLQLSARHRPRCPGRAAAPFPLQVGFQPVVVGIDNLNIRRYHRDVDLLERFQVLFINMERLGNCANVHPQQEPRQCKNAAHHHQRTAHAPKYFYRLFHLSDLRFIHFAVRREIPTTAIRASQQATQRIAAPKPSAIIPLPT